MGELMTVTRKPKVTNAFQVTAEMCRGSENIPFDAIGRKLGYSYLIVPPDKVKQGELIITGSESHAQLTDWVVRVAKDRYQVFTDKEFNQEFIRVSPVPTSHAHFPAEQLELPLD